MAAEHAAIGVQLVDDDELQVLEELRPARMVRQDPRVDHVGVAEHHMRAPANRPARILRRVAVVGEHPDLMFGASRQLIGQLVQLRQLILRERFCREEIERARRGVAKDGAQDRGVVAERLAGRGRRRNDHVAAGERVLDGSRLVRVQLLDAAARSGSRAPADRPRQETARNRLSRAGRRRTAVTHPSGVSGRSPTPPVSRSRAVCSAMSWAGSVRLAGSMAEEIIKRKWRCSPTKCDGWEREFTEETVSQEERRKRRTNGGRPFDWSAREARRQPRCTRSADTSRRCRSERFVSGLSYIAAGRLRRPIERPHLSS